MGAEGKEVYCPAASQGSASQGSGNSCHLLRTLFAGLAGLLLSCHAVLMASYVTCDMCAHALCNKRGHALETMNEATRAGQLSGSWHCFRESQSSSAECAQHEHFVTGLGSRAESLVREQVGVGVRVQLYDMCCEGESN